MPDRYPTHLKKHRQIYERHAKGVTYKQIADEMGKSPVRVREMARRWERELEIAVSRRGGPPNVYVWQDIALLPKQMLFIEADSLESAVELLAYRSAYNVMQMPTKDKPKFYLDLKDELSQKPPEVISKETADEIWRRGLKEIK